MRRPHFLLSIVFMLSACKLMHRDEQMPDNHRLARIVNEYYEERLRLYPLEATINGDGRYNDQLPVNFTESYLDTVGAFYEKYKRRIERIDPEKLNENDRITFEVFTREIGINLEGNQLRMEISPVTMPNVNSNA